MRRLVLKSIDDALQVVGESYKDDILVCIIDWLRNVVFPQQGNFPGWVVDIGIRISNNMDDLTRKRHSRLSTSM